MSVEEYKVDIRTRVLTDNEQIFILFPGEGYTFFDVMKDNSEVFLDYPGLTVSETDLAEGFKDLKERILISDAVRWWHLKGRSEGDSPPSRDVDDYRENRTSQRRRTYAASVERFYSLPDGNLIIVPSPGGAFGTVLVGEVHGDSHAFRIEDYGADTVPSRSITWIADVPKRRFSDEVLARLVTPNPLVLLERTLRQEVVRLSYPNYSFGGEYVARFSTTADTFDSLDDFNIQAFVNYVAGCLAIVDAGTYDGTPVNLETALAALRLSPQTIPELTSNINSPGFLRYITQDVNSLAIAAIMSVALAIPGVAASQIQVTNSAAGKDDPCAYMVDQRVKQAYEIMDIPSLHQACTRIKEASEKTGVRPAVKVVRARAPRRSTES